jgi:hypothetical protein
MIQRGLNVVFLSLYSIIEGRKSSIGKKRKSKSHPLRAGKVFECDEYWNYTQSEDAIEDNLESEQMYIHLQ